MPVFKESKMKGSGEYGDKGGEIELDVRLTGDDISKTLHKISDSITKSLIRRFQVFQKILKM